MRVLILVVACACASTSAEGADKSSASSAIAAAKGPSATATIEPKSESSMTGTAKFVKLKDGLGVHVELKEAPPGMHGVHIHEKGDCSDPKAANAGGHFNPTSSEHHGGAHSQVRHAGDLGNIEVDQSGKGTLDVVVQGLSLDGENDGVKGKAIVIHEKNDDMKTDPSGASGNRVGCGKIQ
jgi:superoxide dismutase, Cu-Zn family